MSDRLTFEEALEKYGTLTRINKGVSMMPMLREGRDLFTVRKKTEERCRENDVVLYKRGDSYVLHRIIEVLPDGYVILGDNCINKEYGYTDADILGVLTEFQRDGKVIKVTDPSYQRYVKRIRATQDLRIFAKKMKSAIARTIRK